MGGSSLLISLVILSLSASAQSAKEVVTPNSYEITYVSNEGFIVKMDDKKVLIDGLFDTIDGNWCDSPDRETVKAMRRAQAPFDSIDIIAVTHIHRDHFDRSIAIEHLLNNPDGILVCPEQVKQNLAEDRHYTTIRNRIVSITPPELGAADTVISDIHIRLLRLEHSHYMEHDPVTGIAKNRHKNIENLGFLMRYRGKSIFHCGDTNPMNELEYKTFAIEQEQVDIAFLERLFIRGGHEGWDVIDNHIQTKQIILMHIDPKNRSVFEDYAKKVPEMTLFQNALESRTFTIPSAVGP